MSHIGILESSRGVLIESPHGVLDDGIGAAIGTVWFGIMPVASPSAFRSSERQKYLNVGNPPSLVFRLRQIRQVGQSSGTLHWSTITYLDFEPINYELGEPFPATLDIPTGVTVVDLAAGAGPVFFYIGTDPLGRTIEELNAPWREEVDRAKAIAVSAINDWFPGALSFWPPGIDPRYASILASTVSSPEFSGAVAAVTEVFGITHGNMIPGFGEGWLSGLANLHG